MSFSPDTEKLVDELIQAEYGNACEKFGEKYHSLHEGYAILLEELEEVKENYKKVKLAREMLWEKIKNENCCVYQFDSLIENIEFYVKEETKELAQVGAVLLKIRNTINEVKQ